MTAILIISSAFCAVGVIVARLMRWWQPAAIGTSLGLLILGYWVAFHMQVG